MALPEPAFRLTDKSRLRRVHRRVMMICVLIGLFYALAEIWLLFHPAVYRAKATLFADHQLLTAGQAPLAETSPHRSGQTFPSSFPIADLAGDSSPSDPSSPADQSQLIVPPNISGPNIDGPNISGLNAYLQSEETIAALVALSGELADDPIYQLQLRIKTTLLTSIQDLRAQILVLMGNEAALNQPPAEKPIGKAPLPASPIEALRQEITTAVAVQPSQRPTDPSVMSVIAKASTAKRAALLANKTAQLLVQRSSTKAEAPEEQAAKASKAAQDSARSRPLPDQVMAKIAPVEPAQKSTLSSVKGRLSALQKERADKRWELTERHQSLDRFVAESGVPNADLLAARTLSLEEQRRAQRARAERQAVLNNAIETIDALIKAGDFQALATTPALVTYLESAETRSAYLAARRGEQDQKQAREGVDAAPQETAPKAASETLDAAEAAFKQDVQSALGRLRAQAAQIGKELAENRRLLTDGESALARSRTALATWQRLEQARQKSAQALEALDEEITQARKTLADNAARPTAAPGLTQIPSANQLATSAPLTTPAQLTTPAPLTTQAQLASPSQNLVNRPQAALSQPQNLPQQQLKGITLLRLISPAEPPDRADSLSPALIRGGSGVLGLLVGLLITLIGLRRDDRLATPAAFEAATGLPVLATISRPAAKGGRKKQPTGTRRQAGGPKRGNRKARKALKSSQPSAWLDAVTEVSRFLQMTTSLSASSLTTSSLSTAPSVTSPSVTSPPFTSHPATSTSLAIFSAMDAPTRSNFVIDLAIAASSDGLEVAVIDCDPHHNFVSKALGEQRAGDIAALFSPNSESEQPTGETSLLGVWLFKLGSLASLGAKKLQRDHVIAKLSSQLSQPGLILLDVPRPDRRPTSRVAARLAETSLVLVDAKATRKRDLCALLNQLSRLGAEIAGLVVIK